MPERHEMALQGRGESGAEEWLCSACGRHIMIAWPPSFTMLVLDDGDLTAIHAGAKGGVVMRQAEVAQVPSTEVTAGEQQWLRNNGIDWDGIAG